MKIEKPDFFEYEDSMPTVPLSEADSLACETPAPFYVPVDTEGYSYFEDVLTGAVTPVKTPIFVCGFSGKCDLKIDQPAEAHTVSRFHATVTTKPDGKQYVTDESLNGTFFADSPEAPKMRLPKGSETLLRDGQIVFFATAAYRFHAGRPAL